MRRGPASVASQNSTSVPAGVSRQCRVRTKPCCKSTTATSNLIQGAILRVIAGDSALGEVDAKPVGAGLLAKAACQSTMMVADTPLSRASPLLQEICGGSDIKVGPSRPSNNRANMG